MKNRTKLSLSILCMAALLSACSGNASTAPAASTSGTGTVTAAAAVTASAEITAPEKATYKDNDFVTDWTKESPVMIRLSGTTAAIEGSGAKAEDQLVTITSPGTYVLSGAWEDGQVVVDVADTEKVRLVLNGVSLHSSGTAPIYVKQADKAIITLQAGTTNSISDGSKSSTAAASDDEPSAAVYSKADLTLNGTGKLTIQGNANDGLTSKDSLKITGGSIEIIAADDGIIGRDLVAVKDGSLSIHAGGDGVKTTNDTDTEKGNIAIEGGSFSIQAEGDGMQSAAAIRIDGGTFDILSGGGSAKAPVKVEERPGPPGSRQAAAATQQAEETDTPSAKAVKATSILAVNAGEFTLDAKEDALHSNGSVSIAGGEMKITAGDDGIHADGTLGITGGTVDISKSYEGIEGTNITIADGTIHVVSSDDGVNISSSPDSSSGGGKPMQAQPGTAGTGKLVIQGGSLTVDAAGDGLDSNGSIVMTGGSVLVYGPTGNNNGALDYDGTFSLSGGTLAAAGSSGMAMAPSDDSSQSSILMTYPQTQAAGTVVRLKDSSGKVLTEVTPTKAFQTIVISTPELKKDSSYTLYSGETKVVDFKVAGSVTWLNESGITTARSGGPGGMPGTGGGGGGRGPGMDGGRARQ